MDAQIIRVLSGTASPDDVAEVERWRTEAPENEAYFEATAQAWSLSAPAPAHGEDARLEMPPVSVIVREAERRHGDPAGSSSPALVPERGPARHGATETRRILPKAVPWGLALAAGVAAVALGIRAIGNETATPGPVATYAAGLDETRTVVLGDGSFIRLASGSQVEELEAEGERRVRLSGRAFFAVAHDADRPFVAITEAGDVQVLGTRFELSEGPSGMRVVVVEGRVAVRNVGGEVDVPSGSVGTVTSGAAPQADVVDDVWALLDWPEGALIFQATPLSLVAREVSRHFGRIVRVTGEGLQGRAISAWFDGESFEEVVESLCAAAGAVCVEQGSDMVMQPTEPGG